MTDVTNRFTGIGVAIHLKLLGVKDGQPVSYCSTFGT